MLYNIKSNITWNIFQNTIQNIVSWVVQYVQCCTTFKKKVVQLHIKYLLIKLYGVSSNIVHKIVHQNINYCTTLNNMYNIVQNLVQFLYQTNISVVQLFKLFMVYNLLYNLVQPLYNVVQNCTGCTGCTTFCTILKLFGLQMEPVTVMVLVTSNGLRAWAIPACPGAACLRAQRATRMGDRAPGIQV